MTKNSAYSSRCSTNSVEVARLRSGSSANRGSARLGRHPIALRKAIFLTDAEAARLAAIQAGSTRSACSPSGAHARATPGALHGDTIPLGRHRADAAHAHIGDRVQVILGDSTRAHATVVAIYTRDLAFGNALLAPSSPPPTKPPRCSTQSSSTLRAQRW